MGTKTAPVGRQYLGSIGKVDNGVVSVHSLWADERRYYPLEVEPYTPAHWFEKGRQDPAFRTKPAIALELVVNAVQSELLFRTVVADSGYGDHLGFAEGPEELELGYVSALKLSHSWWHPVGQVGSVGEALQIYPWSAEVPGGWQKIARRFRDGHQETWWALDAATGPLLA
jgi:SRSO17 transposase